MTGRTATGRELRSTWAASVQLERAPGVELLGTRSQVDLCSRDGCTALVEGRPLLDDVEGPLDGVAAAVLDAYLARGERMLASLTGFFASLILDERRGLLLAVRDPLGVTPLFYARTETWLFAPTMAALLEVPGVPGTVNAAMLADQLRRQWPRAEETCYAAINRVPAGCALRIGRGGTSLVRYWDPPFPETNDDWVDESGLLEFGPLLERSVDRLLEPGRTAIYLSGGLDSVTVAAIAADIGRRSGSSPPLALSLDFPEPHSEAEIQTRVAGTLGAEHVLEPLRDALGEGIVPAALAASARLAAPIQNPWLPAYEHLADVAAARGAKVVLTGSGGDEWLTVSPMYAADLIRRLDVAGLVRLTRSHARSYDVSPLPLALNMLWRFGGRPLLHDLARRAITATAPQVLQRRRIRLARAALASCPWLAPASSLRRTLAARDEEWAVAMAERDRTLPRHGPREYFRACQEGLTHPLVSMEAEEVYEYSRSRGVEVRHPYYDTRLVEFLHRTPPALLSRGGRSKALIRELLAARFPALQFERQRKVVVVSLFGRAIQEEAPAQWRRLGGARALDDAGILDGKALDRRFETVAARPTMSRSEISLMWQILVLEAWLRARSR